MSEFFKSIPWAALGASLSSIAPVAIIKLLSAKVKINHIDLELSLRGFLIALGLPTLFVIFYSIFNIVFFPERMSDSESMYARDYLSAFIASLLTVVAAKLNFRGIINNEQSPKLQLMIANGKLMRTAFIHWLVLSLSSLTALVLMSYANDLLISITAIAIYSTTFVMLSLIMLARECTTKGISNFKVEVGLIVEDTCEQSRFQELYINKKGECYLNLNSDSPPISLTCSSQAPPLIAFTLNDISKDYTTATLSISAHILPWKYKFLTHNQVDYFISKVNSSIEDVNSCLSKLDYAIELPTVVSDSVTWKL